MWELLTAATAFNVVVPAVVVDQVVPPLAVVATSPLLPTAQHETAVPDTQLIPLSSERPVVSPVQLVPPLLVTRTVPVEAAAQQRLVLLHQMPLTLVAPVDCEVQLVPLLVVAYAPPLAAPAQQVVSLTHEMLCIDEVTLVLPVAAQLAPPVLVE